MDETASEVWQAPFYELYVQFAGHSPERVAAALDALWGDETVSGPYARDDKIILHKIDNQPDKVLPAIREFAEEATKTLKTRTNVDLPRRPPWLVSARGALARSQGLANTAFQTR